MPEGESRRCEGSVQGRPPQGHFGGAGPWTDLSGACDVCEGRRGPAHCELANCHNGMVIYLEEALVP